MTLGVSTLLELPASRWVHSHSAEQSPVGLGDLQCLSGLFQGASGDNDAVDACSPRAREYGRDVGDVALLAVVDALEHAICEVDCDVWCGARHGRRRGGNEGGRGVEGKVKAEGQSGVERGRYRTVRWERERRNLPMSLTAVTRGSRGPPVLLLHPHGRAHLHRNGHF